MMFLAGAGVSIDSYRSMDPALAEALSETALEQAEGRAKNNSELLNAVLELLIKRLYAIEAAIRSRPVL